MERAGEPLHLPDLLSAGEKVAGEELWLVEEAIWEFVKIPEVQLSEEEKEYLRQFLANSKTKLSIIETDARADIETLKQYLNLGIKLIPVYDNEAFIKSGNTKDLGTNDIGEIQNLISGKGYRNGLGKGSKIKLFRFFPIDYRLVVIDIDMHSNEDGKLKNNGLKNWLVEIEAKLNLPMDCKFESHTCCVLTPSNGFHLYFKLKEKAELKTEIADAVEIICTKAVNTAGSIKAGKAYWLAGSLDTIPILPDTLKELMVKSTRIIKPLKGINISHNFNTRNGYLNNEEKDALRTLLNEYLIAKGFRVSAKGLTNCPLTEHHNNQDKHPSAQVNHDSLYCFTAGKTYDIYDVAEQLNGGDFKAGIADVINTLGRIQNG
jgi:hypothetical protein